MKFRIKTHNNKTSQLHSHCFYILSKGNNSGKPLLQPCPNCYRISFENETDREQCYWICYGLWQSGNFRPFLVGSVIEFIKIKDAINVLTEAIQRLEQDPSGFSKVIEHLRQINQLEIGLTRQLGLAKQIKSELMRKTLRPKKP